MERFFYLALLIGAMFGLVGQSAAVAKSPNCTVTMDAPIKVQSVRAHPVNAKPMASSQMDCCPEAAPKSHDATPSKGTMQGCMMMSGCFVSLAVDHSPAVVTHVALKPEAATWPLATQLAGRSVQPEQRPPSIQS